MPTDNPFEITETLISLSGRTKEELQELAEIFQLVDTDHGGTISRDELLSLMNTLRIDVTNNELDLMMAEIDPAGTGEINFEGKCKLMQHSH
jgi:Ca2+-binding EF-hand superfamily protein